MEDVAAFPHDDRALEALERVGAEAEPDRLEPEQRRGRDVAQVHVGTDPLHEVALQLGGRRLEEQLRRVDVAVEDLLNEAEAELAVGPADARAAALAGLQRDQEGPGFEVLVDALDPAVGRQELRALRVLEADLGHHIELVGQLPDVAGLLNVREGDGAVRDLHVAAAVALAQVAEVVEAVLQHELLEEGARRSSSRRRRP